jgi:hypothetical protein
MRRKTCVQLAALIADGFLVGLLPAPFCALANEPVDLVLFSGENSGAVVAWLVASAAETT